MITVLSWNGASLWLALLFVCTITCSFWREQKHNLTWTPITYHHTDENSKCTKSSRTHTTITFIINIAWRMRLVEILKFMLCLLVLAMSRFLYKWATLMERSDCRVIFFLLCIDAALVLVMGTVLTVFEGCEDESRKNDDE